ncbi:hypothetical protein TVAG_236800 [Trichomonas vaginalis G3]|uniref:Surface antigen BspA-like n=1 Tax=Trichomonas vaginalis (strain ATCC PRA-98 / G3) TaxID=412133 RepID=A2G7W6_TRIV3|nr:ribonuclease inhibitor domain-containing protein [Trichomonas vaginalis G3]EAX86750.1 hypothetical protein TVAG_236800 [Trichomonas vaginalis G3]KAI5554137.1 ribonuclease inhibitor domain-containing protein [Trichomonas vaginalis G3]|eukprot:XP_001299680.1 hypothetical protein [Trichomonas vaginalis G3]
MLYAFSLIAVKFSFSDNIITTSGEGEISQWDLKQYDTNTIQQIITTNGITKINALAFLEFRYLVKLHLSKTITYFAGNAIRLCSRFRTLTIDPENTAYILDAYGSLLTYDGTFLVYVNRTLNYYEIPSTVKIIGSHSFHQMTRMSYLKIPHNVSRAEKGPFYTAKMKTVEFAEDSLCEAITDNMFAYFVFVNIFIPKLVKLIESNAFYSARSLQNITFAKDSALETIVANAFSLTNILTITLPANVNLSQDAFNFSPNLASVCITNDNTTLQIGCFNGCPNLQTISIEGATKYIFSDGILINALDKTCFFILSNRKSVHFKSDMILSYQLVQICPNLTSVTFDDNSYLTSIDGVIYTRDLSTVFAICGGLREVNISETVKIIGKMSFAGCQNLQKVTFNSDIELIDDNAFQNCNIPELHFKKVETVMENSFLSCTATVIDFEEGPNAISKYSFREINAREFVFKNLKSIKTQAFYSSYVQTITFDESCTVSNLENNAFMICKSLENVTFCSSIRKIDFRCFIECNSLINIVFPSNSSLESIGVDAFKSCNLISFCHQI